MADVVVFDTSAFLTLTGEEPGADTVQNFITDALAGEVARSPRDRSLLSTASRSLAALKASRSSRLSDCVSGKARISRGGGLPAAA